MFNTSSQKAMGKYRIQALPSATSVYKKNGSSLTDTHLAGQQAEGYYAAFSLLPIALEESLGLKANQHPCASRRDQNSPGSLLMKWQNF